MTIINKLFIVRSRTSFYMDKEGIRERLLKKRNLLEKKEIIEKGNLVKEKLFSLKEYKKAKTVMFFVSFGKEIFTHNLIRENRDKKIVVPKIIDFEIIPCIIKDFGELEKGYKMILEPTEVKKADLREIDVVLVPGLAFDKRGYRIGYGKGFYDNFLKKVNALKIGLCMDFQIVDKIPEKEWDIKMDAVITEKRVIKNQ